MAPRKHHTKALMVQGTSSSVGKSVITAALCRILAQNGVKVAPFKAQNMSNNSYVTADGGEMGRAQVVQAQADGVEPHTDMNPVLLKPEADSRSQVVINGKAVGSFASLLGTMELLTPDERYLVKATLINRFRGDLALLDPLPELIAERTRVPVLGVVPFLYDLQVKDEDGVTFGDYDPPALATTVFPSKVIGAEGPGDGTRSDHPSFGRDRGRVDYSEVPSHPMTLRPITVSVIALPRVSNPAELATAHIIIIPDSKSTIAELRCMKSLGLDQAIIEAATKRGVTVVGICGGYQILGQQLDDPEATEAPEPQSEPGLGLLPTSTVFDTTKTTRRVNVEIPAHNSGPLKGPPATGTGYEIHTGITPAQSPHSQL